MTIDPGPYSRVYWSVLDHKRFDPIRADMRHFGSWALMLVVADMAYPAPAFVPPSVPRASLKALVEVGLIELLPARMYRVRGQKKERERRSEKARASALVRWDRNADAERPDSDGNATGMLDETRRDETSKEVDETSTAREETLGVTDEETDLFAFLAQRGAFIRPESGFGVRLLGLVERRGVEAVIEAAKSLDTGERMSDRQWVFGLERLLDEIPSPQTEEPPPVDDTKSKRIYERMVAKRLEYYRDSGRWDPDWGPEPSGAAA